MWSPQLKNDFRQTQGASVTLKEYLQNEKIVFCREYDIIFSR